MTDELIFEVVIKNYPRTIITNSKIKEKYFIKEELKAPIPLKYCDNLIYKHTKERVINGNDYYWKPKQVIRKGKKTTIHILTSYSDNNPVVSNWKQAGTQKFKIINGSDLFRLSLPIYTMTKIKNEIKKVFIKALENIEPINDYPIIIKAELFDTIIDSYGENDWDMDNRFVFYGKYFMDCLAGLKEVGKKGERPKYNAKRIIKDDNRLYVTSPPSVIFTPIKNGEEPKIVFRVYKDTRKEIEVLKHYREETITINIQKPRFHNLSFLL